MSTPDNRDLDSLQAYRHMVLEYEAANAEINALFQIHQGGTEVMTEQELARYRQLQHRRDALFNEIRVLEQQFLDEDAQ